MRDERAKLKSFLGLTDMRARSLRGSFTRRGLSACTLLVCFLALPGAGLSHPTHPLPSKKPTRTLPIPSSSEIREISLRHHQSHTRLSEETEAIYFQINDRLRAGMIQTNRSNSWFALFIDDELPCSALGAKMRLGSGAVTQEIEIDGLALGTVHPGSPAQDSVLVYVGDARIGLENHLNVLELIAQLETEEPLVLEILTEDGGLRVDISGAKSRVVQDALTVWLYLKSIGSGPR